MPLIRGTHSVDNDYTQIKNSWLRDSNLSLGAIGLLAQISSHKPGWTITIQNLANANKIGKDGLRTLLNELIEAGYLSRSAERERNESGQLASYVYITQDPLETGDVSSAEKPTLAEPTLAEPHHKNTIDKKTILKKQQPTIVDENFQPSETAWNEMAEHFPWVDLKLHTHSFIDYWLSVPESKAKKLDWNRTWRNWIRRVAEQQKPKGYTGPVKKHKF